MDWECEIEDRKYHNFDVVCDNGETEAKVTVTLKEQKVFPEENYEYEGKINGKPVEGFQTFGYGPMKSIEAIDGEKLTDLERAAGKTAMER